MTDEQGRVLDMLSQGKLSAEEAERLLAALSAGRGGGTEFDRDSGTAGRRRERVTVVLETTPDDDAEHSRDDSFAVGETPRVVVNNTNGRIECAVGDDGTVRVQASLRNARSVKYSATQEGDTVTVDAKSTGKPSTFGFFGRSEGADIVVTAPRRTQIDLKTTNGAVEATGFEGSVSAQSNNGRISVSGVKADFDVSTKNGRISIRECEGAGKVGSKNGAIGIDNVKGSIDAETSNGSMAYSGEMSPGGKNRLETVNGSIRVKLLGTPSLKIDASCAVGRISSKLPGLTTSGMVEQKLAGTLGDGDAELTIRTSNGSVTIE